MCYVLEREKSISVYFCLCGRDGVGVPAFSKERWLIQCCAQRDRKGVCVFVINTVGMSEHKCL